MHDSESVVDDSAKADIFNHYFHSVFTQEDLSSLDSLKHSLKYCSPIISHLLTFYHLLCAGTLMCPRPAAQILFLT